MELARGTVKVPQGDQQWIEWQVPPGTSVPTTGYVRVDLTENSNVLWHVAGAIEPGHLSAFQMAPATMRRYSSGVTLALKVDPPQSCFPAENVISGKSRPHDQTHLWRSDPHQSLPQWVELRWQQPQTLLVVQVTFPGHLLREYHAYAPFYRDPQCARDYEVHAEISGKWTTIATVEGNYQRLRRHTFDQPITVSAIRIVILATHGDPSAAIYEIRAW
jgi:F5/8 type C domain